MLEADAENSWWNTMPDKIKEDVEAAIKEADNGEIIPHAEIQKRLFA